MTLSTKTLDVIVASNHQQVQETVVQNYSISDRDLEYCIRPLKNQRRKPTFITTRSFKNYDSKQFNADISQYPWSVLEVFDECEDDLYALLFIIYMIYYSTSEHAPVKIFKSHGHLNPFVTSEIPELVRTRDKWKKEYKKTKDPLAWLAYKNYCREVKYEIRMAEKEFFMDQVLNNRNNTNSLWKAIRSRIPKRSQSQRSYSKDHKIVTDEFNNYFANVGKTTVDKITEMTKQTN